MNKSVYVGYSLFVLWCLMVSGCVSTTGKVTPMSDVNDVHTIKPISLTPAADQQINLWDANQTPPQQLELTLEKCRAAVLQNNLQLKTRLIDPVIAEERVQQERARFDAVFNSGVGLRKNDSPGVNQLAQITGTTTEQSSAQLGLSIPLLTGGTASGQLSDYRQKDYPGSLFDPSYSPSSRLSLQQPLLRNAGPDAMTFGLQISSYEHQIVNARTKLEVIQVIADLDRIYWRLYAAQKELEVREQQYHLAQAQLETAHRLVDIGEQTQIEITRAEAGVAQRVEAIIQAKNSLEDRERDIKRAINSHHLGLQSETNILAKTPPKPIRYELDKAKLVELAVENRMEMVELQLQLAQDALTVDYRRNQKLPLVMFDYSYNVSATGGSRASAYDVLWGTRFAGHSFGLNLEIPVGNHAAKSQLRQALYERIQHLATKEDRRSQIELEVLNAVDQLETNWQRIIAGQHNTVLNNRLYEAEKRQYELGLRTSTDVLNAQTQSADAQLSELSALVEYQIALVDLAYATGTLLGAANVEWKPIVPGS